ncbi:sensor histidine kinase [Streptomyces sp. NPDC086835]|uniref:sensor histidine kinase n=1 Tax=Streptomyces sp. NPDC086835 TaxID=3365761 RepID=UPI0037F42DE1
MDARRTAARARALARANPWYVDIGVALLVQAAMTMPFVMPRPVGTPPATWAAYGLTTLTVLPLVWRRRAPVAVLLAVLAAGGLYQVALDGPGQPLPYTGLVVVHTVAALSPPAKRLGVLLSLPLIVAASVWLNSRSLRELTFSLFVLGAAYAFGRLADTKQAYIAAVEDRAAQLERANRIEAEQSAARERARIAREMHDILSHAVSLMIVQAEAGPVTVRTDPRKAEAAFDAISEAGRDAMAQLRGMLGVLRENEAHGAPRAPQPDIGDLPALIDRVRAGGLEVSCRTEGAAGALPPATGATVFRVVQEALTNVVKHAGAARASVRLRHGPGALEITVTDDGRGAAPAGGPGRTGGHGLTGIRERVAAHGGTASTGAGPGGRGFEVRVVLPLPAGTSGSAWEP